MLHMNELFAWCFAAPDAFALRCAFCYSWQAYCLLISIDIGSYIGVGRVSAIEVSINSIKLRFAFMPIV